MVAVGISGLTDAAWNPVNIGYFGLPAFIRVYQKPGEYAFSPGGFYANKVSEAKPGGKIKREKNMSEHFSPQSERFMRRALELARRGWGKVSPNPAVGAVVVKDGVIVGEGYHLWEKKDHAEVVALSRAGSRASGGDLYVTLEPCCHFGRTPPCVDAILASGIRNVFVAVEDPNPMVSGKGIARLRESSVNVESGLLRREALELNRFFFHSITTGLPFVTLKLAMSMDGRIATSQGDSRWITGEAARKYVHQLRYRHDAILVGSGTLKADDPSLDVRGSGKKQIIKVVLDSNASSVSSGSRILKSGDPVIVFYSSERIPVRPDWAVNKVEYIGVPENSRLLSWRHVLEELGKRQIRSLLVEGGGSIAGSLVKEGLVNGLCLFYGSMLIGSEGVPGVGRLNTGKLSEAFRFSLTRCSRFGNDLCVEGECET